MQLTKGEYFGLSQVRLEHDGVGYTLSEYAACQEQPWHTHEHPTLFVHLSGQLVDDSGSHVWTLPRLALTYHPAHKTHRTSIGTKGAKGINLDFSQAWLEKHGIEGLGEHRVLASDAIATNSLHLVNLVAGGDGWEDAALELLQALDPSTTGENTEPGWFAKAVERIHAEFRYPIGLSTIAAEVGVHPTYLARVYRERRGESVTATLHRLRLQAAADGILEGASIGEAAAEAGFSDQFHLSRMLKREFGYRPSLLKALRSQATSGNRS